MLHAIHLYLFCENEDAMQCTAIAPAALLLAQLIVHGPLVFLGTVYISCNRTFVWKQLVDNNVSVLQLQFYRSLKLVNNTIIEKIFSFFLLFIRPNDITIQIFRLKKQVSMLFNAQT